MKNINSFLLRSLFVLLVISSAFLSSCQKSADIIPADIAKLALLDTMRLWYYWNTSIPASVDVSKYQTVPNVLNAFKNPLDRFSYIDENGSFANQLKGTPQDYGLAGAMKFDANNNVRFGAVYKESPLGQAGVTRGCILNKIGGQVPTNNNLNSELGKVSNTFEITFLDGTVKTLNLSQASYNSNPILFKTVFTQDNKKIAYLVFNNFLFTGTNASDAIRNANASLNTIFGEFKQAGATELILDLRYNGGGYSDVAAYLAGLIAPNTANGKVYSKEKWNSYIQAALVRQGRNVNKTFQIPANSLNLSRVVVITTGRTASASEQLINNLKPYMNVVTLGAKTYGKPSFNYLFNYKPKNAQELGFYLTLGVEANANGDGEFFDGITPTFTATDDATKDFGDRTEISLAQALQYIQAGTLTNGRIESEDGQKSFDIGAVNAWNIVNIR